jgi:adenylate kinase
LVITGNPGVGKHTSADMIAKRLGAEIIDINKIAIEKNAIAKKTARGIEVDVNKLTRLLTKSINKKNDQIIVGHLAPYVVRSAGIRTVAVLRRSPYKLAKTLKDRGYSDKKVRENLESEILGISLHDAMKRFGKRKVSEFNTTDMTSSQTAEEIIASLRKKPAFIGIDWLGEISERGDLKKFFDY